MSYSKGRGDVSPSEYWYDAELAFFDDCVLPLARKLKDAKIFGVSSEEYYNYALRNREEWEDKGREVVTYMSERVRSKLRSQNRTPKVVPTRTSRRAVPKFDTRSFGLGSRMDAIAE